MLLNADTDGDPADDHRSEAFTGRAAPVGRLRPIRLTSCKEDRDAGTQLGLLRVSAFKAVKQESISGQGISAPSQVSFEHGW